MISTDDSYENRISGGVMMNNIRKYGLFSLLLLIFCLSNASIGLSKDAKTNTDHSKQSSASVQEKAPYLTHVKDFKLDGPFVDAFFRAKKIKKVQQTGTSTIEVSEDVVYPKFITTEEDSTHLVFSFFNDNGAIVKKYKTKSKYSAAGYSENGKFIGISEYLPRADTDAEELMFSKFLMLDENGKVLWTVPKANGSARYISPSGKYALFGCSPSGESDCQIFYDNGAVKRPDYDIDLFDLIFMQDGSKFITTGTTSALVNGKKGPHGWIALYKYDTRLLWKRILKSEEYCRFPMFSHDEMFVAVFCYETAFIPANLYLFDNNGNQLWKTQMGFGDYHSAFSDDDKTIVASVDNSLFIIDSNNGKVLSQFTLDDKRFYFREVYVHKDNFITIVRYSQDVNISKNSKEKLLVFNKRSEIIRQMEFKPNKLKKLAIVHGERPILMLEDNGSISQYNLTY